MAKPPAPPAPPLPYLPIAAAQSGASPSSLASTRFKDMFGLDQEGVLSRFLDSEDGDKRDLASSVFGGTPLHKVDQSVLDDIVREMLGEK
jgi:hypothetical protein